MKTIMTILFISRPAASLFTLSASTSPPCVDHGIRDILLKGKRRSPWSAWRDMDTQGKAESSAEKDEEKQERKRKRVRMKLMRSASLSAIRI
jgi:hypothetical protein